MELPKCEICGVRPVFYQRIRSGDVCDLPEDIKLPSGNTLLEVLRHACDGILFCYGDRLWQQPTGGKGFIEYTDISRMAWEVHTECPEAARLLREMRNA